MLQALNMQKPGNVKNKCVFLGHTFYMNCLVWKMLYKKVDVFFFLKKQVKAFKTMWLQKSVHWENPTVRFVLQFPPKLASAAQQRMIVCRYVISLLNKLSVKVRLQCISGIIWFYILFLYLLMALITPAPITLWDITLSKK